MTTHGQEESALRASMVQERDRWDTQTRIYGTAYVVVRIFLIVASSIVAAKTALTTNHVTTLLNWLPILALLVTIFTALDTWMKPQQKWQGFMRDRDDLDDLLAQLEGAEQDSQRIDTVRKEFKSLRQRHRDQNVF